MKSLTRLEDVPARETIAAVLAPMMDAPEGEARFMKAGPGGERIAPADGRSRHFRSILKY
jgi:hypothetical protein